MLKDTKSLGNNKAPACESRGFVLKKKVCFLTHLLVFLLSPFGFSSGDPLGGGTLYFFIANNQLLILLFII